LSGLGVHVTVTDVALTRVATTPLGVLGDSGPVSSPQAPEMTRSVNEARETSVLRIVFLILYMSLMARI
jgi:hypothetical protein